MRAFYAIFLISIGISLTVSAKVAKILPTKHHQAYPVDQTDTKWMHSSQLDSILMSMEEKLHQISEKQKQDPTSVRISNDLEIISHRLQNVEEQIARAESYNKMRLEQLIENTMKSEFLIDQLGRRMERNQQQIMNRLTEIDSSVEKSNKAQENLERNFRKIEILQNQVTTSLAELSETMNSVKSQTVETLRHVNTTRQEFEERFSGIMKKQNVSLRKEASEVGNITIHTQNDIVQTGVGLFPVNDLQKAMKDGLDEINEKHNMLLQNTLLLKTSTEECRSLGTKIYNKVTNEQLDVGDYLDNFLETLVQDIKSENVQLSNKLDSILKNNIDLVLNEQHVFMKNCHRLQSNEEQIEDKVVSILQNLFSYIDNRTERAQHDLQTLLNFESAHDSNQNNLVEDLSRLIKRENSELKKLELDSASQLSLLGTNVSRLTNDLFMLQNDLNLVNTNIQHIKQFLPAINENETENVLSRIITVNASTKHEFDGDSQLQTSGFLKNVTTFVEITNPSKVHVHKAENLSSQSTISTSTDDTKSRESPVFPSRIVRSSAISSNISSDGTVPEQTEYEGDSNEDFENYQ